MHSYITQHASRLKKLGYTPQPHAHDQEYGPGAYNKSHAEKQAFLGALDRLQKQCDTAKKKAVAAVGVTRPVCPEDCYPFFRAVAQLQGRNIVVADPDAIWVFTARGLVLRKVMR